MNTSPFVERLRKGARLLTGGCRSGSWWAASRFESITSDARCSKEFREWSSKLKYYDGLYAEACASARALSLPEPVDPIATQRLVPVTALAEVPLKDLVSAGLVITITRAAGEPVLLVSDDAHRSVREGGQEFVLASEARDLAMIWADDPTEGATALEGLFKARKVLD